MSQSSSPRDFSLFSLFTAGLACMIPFASAYTQPTGDAPEGNPISQPGLNSIVPVGKEFSVTWEPTTKGTVTLVLLKGPSSDAEPQYAIVEKVKNSGTYVWTPSTDLAPTTDATGYGIQLIDDSTGQYQYTTQFGISNPDYDASTAASSSSSSSSASATSTGWAGHGGYGGGAWTDSWSESWSSTVTASASSKTHHNGTTLTTSTAPYVTGASSGVPHNVTMVAPTGAMTVPSTLRTATATSSASKTAASSAAATASSGAAASMRTSFAGLVFAGAVAVFAL